MPVRLSIASGVQGEEEEEDEEATTDDELIADKFVDGASSEQFRDSSNLLRHRLMVGLVVDGDTISSGMVVE